MKKFFKSLLLLSVIFTSILASCPDYPTIPTSSPMLIDSSSPGMSNYPSSTQQLSMTMFITPDEVCTTGAIFPLFSMDITPSGGTQEYLSLQINCNNLIISFKSNTWFTSDSFAPFTSAIGPVGIFMSFDLAARNLKFELQTEKTKDPRQYSIRPSGLTFDSNSKFYLCADQNGASPKACTVSDLAFEYRYYGETTYPYGHVGGIKPSIEAFYPLSGKSLATSLGSASPAYFGDDETNPADGTSPSWDSSKNFVSITAGQFITFSLPDVSSTIPTISHSLSFSAWVKITDLPSDKTTLFAMYSSAGSQVGYKVQVDKTSKKFSISFGSNSIWSQGGIDVTLTLDTWQLVGFMAYANTEVKTSTAIIFSGTSWAPFTVPHGVYTFDLSAASVIRVGDSSDSFNGQVSIVRIMKPAGIVKTTDLCSSANSMELGVGSFALACSGDKILSSADNTCIASCPSLTYKATAIIPLCVACSDHCTSCDSAGCLACEANYLVYQGGCIGSCPSKTYKTGSTCKDCSAHCSACESSGCLTCETNYLSYKGGCVDSCPRKSYSDLTSCIACSDHCVECDANGCKACDDGYELDADKKCTAKSSPTPSKPTTEEAASSSSDGISGGAVAGIACGSVAVISLAGWAAYSFIGKKIALAKSATKVTPFEAKGPSTHGTSSPVSPAQTELDKLVP